MGEATEAVREPSPRKLAQVLVPDDPKMPWWASWGIRALMIVGIPGALLASREYRDYKYEATRLENERARIAVEEKRNVIFERFEKVLYKVERKLPNDNNP